MEKGKIITFEGGDGVGKKTHAEMLVERLKKEGYDVETLSFPRYETPTGKIIRAYLDGKFGSLNEVPVKIASAFYTADRLAAQQEIKAWIEEGKIVVLDRYLESNMVYQAAKLPETERMESMEWLKDFEINEFGILPSDIVICLTLTEEAALKAMAAENREKDILEGNRDYQIEVHKTYHQAAKLFGWKTVDCIPQGKRLPKEEVAGKIWEVVKEKLSPPAAAKTL